MAAAETGQEIERAVNRALARRGIDGRVQVRDKAVELHAEGPPLAIDIGDWIEQWQLLPEELRARKVNEVVQRLVLAAGGRPERQGATGRRRSVSWQGVLVGLVTIALVAVGIRWLWSSNFFGPGGVSDLAPWGEPATATSAEPETPAEGRERTARVCEAARKRILSGGNMTGLDSAGWDVVLWLARLDEPADGFAAIERAVADESLAQRGREAVRIEAPVEIVLARGPQQRLAAVTPHAVELRLRGGFSEAFLQAPKRSPFVSWVAELVRESDAQVAALFGSCAHLQAHDLGAWYWGRDDAHAAAALLATAGLLAEPPAFSLASLPQGSPPLARLLELGAGLDGRDFEGFVREAGGKVQRVKLTMVTDGGPAVAGTALRFALAGPTRAARASRQVAKAVRLGGANRPDAAP